MFILGQRNRSNSTQSRKFSTGRASLVFAAALAAAVGYGAGATNTATATPLYWTGSAAGTALADTSGSWDTTAGNTVWSTASTGGTASLWTNGDAAVFGAGTSSSATVTIDTSGITATGMTFNAMSSGAYYTISSTSTNTLALSGTITMNANAYFFVPIVGAGALTIAGPDKLTLFGVNTYTGGTTISSGTLALSGTGSIAASSGVTLDTGGTSNSVLDISGLTNGGASLISLASASIGAGSGTASVVLGANTLTITNGSGNFAGVISGTGGLTLSAGTETLSGANTYGGITTITGGTLEFTGSTAGLTGNVTDNAALSFNQTANSSLSGIISGTGTVTEAGTAGTVLTLSGANTYSGATTITSGTLEFTGDTSSLTGNVTDNSALSFNQTGSSSLSGIISGTGTVTEAGAAGTVLTLAGANTYTGGTTITSGTLSVASDANLGSTAGAITLNGGTLDYTGASGTVANAVNVSGGVLSTFVDSGSGTVTLTGPITNNTGNILAFSGGTFNLNEVGSGTGTFQIGDAPSTVIVSNPNAFGSGAILLTTGSTLETTNVVSNTGTAIGITGGSYTQQAGSTLALVVNSWATYDSIQLGGGSASLNGTLNLIFDGVAPLTGQHYVVIGTTGSVTGSFSSVVLGGLAPSTTHGLATYVAGTGEEIYIESQYFTLAGLTPNQAAVAGYLNTNAVAPGTPTAIVDALNSISLLPQSQQGAYLNVLTPQDYAQVPTQAFQNSTFLNQEVFGQVQNAFEGGGFNTSGLTVLKTTDQNPFSISMDSAMNSAQQQAKNSVAYLDSLPGAGPEVPTRERISDRFSGFILGTITMDKLPQNSGSPSEHFTTGGVLTGLDYRLTKNLVVGALFNWNYTGGTMDNAGSRQQTNSYTPGLFAGYSKGGFYADGLLSYTYNSYKLHRNVVMPGSTTVATGEPDSNQYDAAALVGYYLPVAHGLKIGPAAGADFTQINVSGMNETGSPFDLSVSKQHADSLRSLLGMQGSYAFHIGANPLPISVNFNAFWQHEFLNSSRNISATFTSLGGGSFLYSTPSPSRDSALLGLGASGYMCKNVSLFVNYETQIGAKNQFAQTVMAGVGVSF